MLKLTKKADYSLMAMKHLAENPGSCSAKEMAEAYGIPQAALAKILQKLVKVGLLASHHGTNGGYVLARDARKITALEVIKAIDGPLFITACVTTRGECYQTAKCTVREPLRKVNESIQEVLSRITIWEMKDEPENGAEAEAKRPEPAELVTLA